MSAHVKREASVDDEESLPLSVMFKKPPPSSSVDDGAPLSALLLQKSTMLVKRPLAHEKFDSLHSSVNKKPKVSDSKASIEAKRVSAESEQPDNDDGAALISLKLKKPAKKVSQVTKVKKGGSQSSARKLKFRKISEIMAVTAEVDSREKEAALVQCSIEESKIQRQVEDQTLHSLVKELGNKEKQAGSIQGQLSSCSLDVESKKREYEEIQRSIEKQKREYEAIQRSIEKQKRECEAIQRSIEMQNREHEAKGEQLESMQRLINECERQLKLNEEQRAKELEMAHKAMREREEVQKKMQKEVEEYEEQLQEKEAQLSMVEGMIRESEEDLKAQETEFQEVLDNIDNHLRMKEGELGKLLKKIVDCTKKLKAKEQELMDKVQEEKELQLERKKLLQVISIRIEQESQLQTMESKKEELEGQIKELESKAKEIEERVKELDSKEKLFEERVNEFESKEKVFEGRAGELEYNEKVFKVLMTGFESKQKQHEERAKELASKEKQVEGQVVDLEANKKKFEEVVKKLQLEEKKVEGRLVEIMSKEKQIEGREMELASKEEELESKKKHFDGKWKEFEEQVKELRYEEEQFEDQMKEFSFKQKQYQLDRKDFELMQKQFEGEVKEFEFKKERHEALMKSYEEKKVQDNDSSSSRTGRGLQSLSTVLSNELLAKDVLVQLRASPDPAELILKMINDPFLPTRKAGRVVIIEDKHIFMLNLLMRNPTHIKPQVREAAKKLAFELKASCMNGRNVDTLAALGFLLVVSVYRLASSFSEDELLKHFEIAAHHKLVPELFQIFRFVHKAPDFVENLIKNHKYVEAVRFICTFKLRNNQPVKLLREHVRRTKLICESKCKKTKSIQIKARAKEEASDSLESALLCILEHNLKCEDLAREIEIHIHEHLRLN